MTKIVPAAVTLPSRGEVTAGRPVLASTWEDMLSTAHYAYGRQGAHILHAVFDPPWLSLDFGSGGNAYHSVGQAVVGGQTLDQVQGVFRFSRPTHQGSADGYSIALSVYAQNVNVRATLVRLNNTGGNTGDVTEFTGLVTTHGADSEWEDDSEPFTIAQASRDGDAGNGLAYFLVRVQAIVPASGEGTIHQIAIRETPITADNDLPRGI